MILRRPFFSQQDAKPHLYGTLHGTKQTHWKCKDTHFPSHTTVFRHGRAFSYILQAYLYNP